MGTIHSSIFYTACPHWGWRQADCRQKAEYNLNRSPVCQWVRYVHGRDVPMLFLPLVLIPVPGLWLLADTEYLTDTSVIFTAVWISFFILTNETMFLKKDQLNKEIQELN